MKDSSFNNKRNSSAVANQSSKGSNGVSMSAPAQLKADVAQFEGLDEEKLQMKKNVTQLVGEEDEKMQMKTDVTQLAGEEDEKMQLKADVTQLVGEEDEKMQMKADVTQLAGEEEEKMQLKADVTQLAGGEEEKMQMKEDSPAPNHTGMPDNLKSGIESMSGMDMSDVKVNYNSGKPKDLGALAYAQGNDIQVGPGQEKHLPHEAWHVVQQRQGRVQATKQFQPGGVAINDDKELEKEADVMGSRALKS